MELSEAVLKINEAVILNIFVLSRCMMNDLVDLMIVIFLDER